jgi:5-methylcytosine-specific restriction endonuclease McrA
VVASAVVCWRCGEPARPGDPLTADHVVPRVAGGSDSAANMLPAHRSCNSRAGAALQQGLPVAS